MEFCTLPPGQQFKKPTSDSDLTAAMLKFTPKTPFERRKQIVQSLTSVLNYQEGNTYLSQAGISINPTPLVISGTVLPLLSMTFRDRTNVVSLLNHTNERHVKGFN